MTQAPLCELGVGRLAGSRGIPHCHPPDPLHHGREAQPAMDMGSVALGGPNAIPGLSLPYSPRPNPLST